MQLISKLTRDILGCLLAITSAATVAQPQSAADFSGWPSSLSASLAGASSEPINYSLSDDTERAFGDHAFRVSSNVLRPDARFGQPFASLRATYRYTWLERLSWSAQIGFSSRVDEPQNLAGLPVGMRLSNNTASISAPRLHLAAGGQLLERLGWAVETDSLLRRRGAALDLDLRVNYSLTHALRLFGGFRWNDTADEDLLSAAVARSGPTVGMRYRF